VGPRELFERSIVTQFLSAEYTGDYLADDVVIEWPFAAPGRPRRVDGRAAFLAIARPGRAAMPFRFDECVVEAVHETADPEVIVAEYRLGGTLLSGGERRSAPFVSVIRVRDGLVTHWREYQDTYAMVRALGG
jgi:hypothetical protein